MPEKFSYAYLIQIKHPSENLRRVIEEIGLEPDFSWQVGDPRRAANGADLLGGGFRKQTYYCYETSYWDDRHFFGIVDEALRYLEAAREYLLNLVDSGGSVALTIRLAGKRNIFDVLRASDLARLGTLGVRLGIEVFPHMRE